MTDFVNIEQTNGETSVLGPDLEESAEQSDESAEEFGMYDSALPSWLSQRPGANDQSLRHYTNRPMQHVRNVSSVNSAIQLTTGDYIPYLDDTRFKRPGFYEPNTNPEYKRFVRDAEGSS